MKELINKKNSGVKSVDGLKRAIVMSVMVGVSICKGFGQLDVVVEEIAEGLENGPSLQAMWGDQEVREARKHNPAPFDSRYGQDGYFSSNEPVESVIEPCVGDGRTSSDNEILEESIIERSDEAVKELGVETGSKEEEGKEVNKNLYNLDVIEREENEELGVSGDTKDIKSCKIEENPETGSAHSKTCVVADVLDVAKGDEEHMEYEDNRVTNSIIAVVEKTPITLSQVREQLIPLIPQIQRESFSQRDFDLRVKALEKQIIDNIIDGILIVKDFKGKKYQIPKGAIETEMNEFIQTRFNGDKIQFTKYLKSIGKSYRQFKKDMEDRIIIQVMQDQMLRSRSEVSPEMIKDYYAENKEMFLQEETYEMSQITLKGPIMERDGLTVKILNELEEGKEFGELAKKYSQDNKAAEGGYWGWIGKRSLRPEFVSVFSKAKIKSYTPAIILEDRTYILFLNDKKLEGYKPLEEVRLQIEGVIAQEISRKAYSQWIDRLRRNAYIKYY